MRRPTKNFSAVRTWVEGNNGRLLRHLPDLRGPWAAASSALRADMWDDSSTALPPCHKLVSCFSSTSLLKLNVFFTLMFFALTVVGQLVTE